MTFLHGSLMYVMFLLSVTQYDLSAYLLLVLLHQPEVVLELLQDHMLLRGEAGPVLVQLLHELHLLWGQVEGRGRCALLNPDPTAATILRLRRAAVAGMRPRDGALPSLQVRRQATRLLLLLLLLLLFPLLLLQLLLL